MKFFQIKPIFFYIIFKARMFKHFIQKFWGKYVAMATMICVKHFMNIPDIFFNSCFKNNLRKKKGFI
jgi:hypothetical protein